MSEVENVAGSIAMRDGRFRPPPEYRGDDIVVRTPHCTWVFKGRAVEYYRNEDSEIPDGIVSIRRFGETRVEFFGVIEDE